MLRILYFELVTASSTNAVEHLRALSIPIYPDLILAHLRKLLFAQYAALRGFLSVAGGKPLRDDFLPSAQELPRVVDIAVLPVIHRTDLAHRAVRLNLHRIVRGIGFFCLAQEQQVALVALHALEVSVVAGDAMMQVISLQQDVRDTVRRDDCIRFIRVLVLLMKRFADVVDAWKAFCDLLHAAFKSFLRAAVG